MAAAPLRRDPLPAVTVRHNCPAAIAPVQALPAEATVHLEHVRLGHDLPERGHLALALLVIVRPATGHLDTGVPTIHTTRASTTPVTRGHGSAGPA